MRPLESKHPAQILALKETYKLWLWVGEGGGEQGAAKEEKDKDWKHGELERLRVQQRLCHNLYL